METLDPAPFTTTLLHHAADPFRLLVESVKDYAIYLLDPAGRIVSWNTGAERIKGYTAKEVLGQPFDRMFSPEDAANGNPKRIMDAALANGRYEHEGTRPRKDGSLFWAIQTVTALQENDRNVGFAVITRDISERKRAEAELRASEERFRLLVEGVKDYAIYMLDVTGTVQTWNGGAAHLYGYTADEIIGQHRKIFFTPEDVASGVPQHELDVAAAKGHASEEVWQARKDGSLFWANGTMSALHDTAGGVRGFVKVVRDLTERKLAENELRLRDRAIQAVSPGIIITDSNQADNPIIYASRGFERITGYTANEVLGRNCRFLQAQDTDPATVREIREAILAGRECSIELLNYKRDGTPFWNALFLTPVHDDGGKLVNYVGVMVDVTERRTLERALQQSQKMDAIGRLAGGVAHDFNNLLTIISGYSDILLGDMLPTNPHREMMVEIRHAGERAAGLTRQLLAFSRKEVIEPVILDLNDLVAETEKMLRRLIGEDITTVAILDPNLPPVKADPGQIDQIIMNLCVNARDAMPTGGRLTIETHDVVVQQGQSAHPAPEAGHFAMLSVTDTGHGMTEQVKAQIFEPFFTTKDPGKGTGLGLATVFGIVKQSNAHISVESEVGVGSTFKILFPAVDDAPTSTAKSGSSRLGRGNETVLLVEDEEGVRKIARISLEAQGYTVLEAFSGIDAIQKADQYSGTIHLVITDVVMPEMGGRQMADALRSRHPQVKILYMSGYTDDAVVRHGIMEGRDAFLQKPFTPLALAKKMRAMLDETK